ncbi:glycosyltransferase family 2 protein [Terrimonas alba]|uniref:glycosyltransferase family 2 protein n=1 Tax=Terrimonas alba TaxID=3349636 RepID=UPI0035F4EE90
MKLVSIITVNFNQPGITEDLLDSIFSLNNYTNVEIIVVDNGSTVDPVPGWKKKYPSVRFIRSEKNTGFAGGNNLGLSLAKGDYIFLINNDTEVTENLVTELVSTLDKNPTIGLISPKILYHHSDIIQYAGYTPLEYITGKNKCIGQFETDKGQYDKKTGKTGYAHGAAMMVNRRAIEKAGVMEENFFLYYEELDWSERIRKRGFEIWVNPQAVIYHKESVSVGKQSPLKEYYMNRNRILIVRKHAPTLVYPIFMAYFLCVVVPVKLIRYLKAKQGRLIPLLGQAIWWNMNNKTDSHNFYSPSHKIFKK